MEGFYVSLVFIGILLVIITLFSIALDRKRSYDYTKKLDQKKDELVGIIKDAELMVQELNKFSDYIVSQVDDKNKELCSNLDRLDAKMTQLNNTQISYAKTEASNTPDQPKIDISVGSQAEPFDMGNDLIVDSLHLVKNATTASVQSSQVTNRERIALGLSSKYQEVIELAEKGMSVNDIAKRLKLGKGEIQLVLGINNTSN